MLVQHFRSFVSACGPSLQSQHLHPLYVCVLGVFSTVPIAVYAESSVASEGHNLTSISDVATVRFDPSFITTSSQSEKIDLSRFERTQIILPGTYRVDLTVNGQWRGREDFTFVKIDEHENAVPCFDRVMMARLGVDLEKVALAKTSDVSTVATSTTNFLETTFCGNIDQFIPEAQINFDMSEQKIAISVPQLYMKRSARGWVNPDQWDSGVPAAMLSYNVNNYHASSDGRNQTQSYLGLMGGVNIGDWHLRHNGSYSWSGNGARSGYQNGITHLQRDITAAKAQLLIGDSFTNGDLFDSIRIRGVQLCSDDRMLPDSQRGYAPVVRGTAETNAKVTIKQRGFILYETIVAPGPFEINDLFATGYGGDLEVMVIEANGQEKNFTVPFSATVQLLRPGVTRYSLSAGQVRELNLVNQPSMVQVTAQHGIDNTFTGYAGGMASDGYLAALIGMAANTPVGAFSADLTSARKALPPAINGNKNDNSNGQSIRFGYNKNMTSTGTNLSLAAYRYSTSGYLSLLDAVRVRDAVSRYVDTSRIGRQRSRLDVNINQVLASGYGAIYTTGSSISYWNNVGNQLKASLIK